MSQWTLSRIVGERFAPAVAGLVVPPVRLCGGCGIVPVSRRFPGRGASGSWREALRW